MLYYQYNIVFWSFHLIFSIIVKIKWIIPQLNQLIDIIAFQISFKMSNLLYLPKSIVNLIYMKRNINLLIKHYNGIRSSNVLLADFYWFLAYLSKKSLPFSDKEINKNKGWKYINLQLRKWIKFWRYPKLFQEHHNYCKLHCLISLSNLYSCTIYNV